MKVLRATEEKKKKSAEELADFDEMAQITLEQIKVEEGESSPQPSSD